MEVNIKKSWKCFSLERKNWGKAQGTLIIYFLWDKKKMLKKKKAKEKTPSNCIHEESSFYLSCFRNISEGLNSTGGCRVPSDILTSSLRPDSMVSWDERRLLREKTRLPWPSVSLRLMVIRWKSSADLHFQNLVHKSFTSQAETFSIQGILDLNHWLWLSSLAVSS